MDAEQHVEERAYPPAHSADVRSTHRHVRTRLYFTSEVRTRSIGHVCACADGGLMSLRRSQSHIHSLFNVLRWGCDVLAVDARSVSATPESNTPDEKPSEPKACAASAADPSTPEGSVRAARARRGGSDGARGARGGGYDSGYAAALYGAESPDGSEDGVPSIFSDEARRKFDELELGYLTHIVFRVLHKKGADPTAQSSYAVQVLVSPGVSANLSPDVAAAATKLHASAVDRPDLLPSEMFISSRDDLTLEDVERFFSYFLAVHKRSGPANVVGGGPHASRPASEKTTAAGESPRGQSELIIRGKPARRGSTERSRGTSPVQPHAATGHAPAPSTA